MSYQIVSAERPDAESQLSAVLNHLREIDAQIPIGAKLPGSPTLTDQMAHLLRKYLELRKVAIAAKEIIDGGYVTQQGISKAYCGWCGVEHGHSADCPVGKLGTALAEMETSETGAQS